jgi:UDP-glucose 4-epimerase
MAVLVTGSDGMVGKRLVERLKANGHFVYEFGDDKDIRKTSDWAELAYNYKNARQNRADTIDYIIHLAALAGVRPSFDDPELYYDVNVNGTQQMLQFSEYIKPHSPSHLDGIKILYASSSNAYEWYGNPYATTKKMNEIQCQSYNAIGMRFHTIWPGRDDMLFKTLERGDVTYINNNHYRDFVHVDDILQAITLLMTNFDRTLDLTDKVVDIGTGQSVSVAEVARVMGYKGKYVGENPSGERVYTKANIEPLLQLGYTPKWNILDYENCPS